MTTFELNKKIADLFLPCDYIFKDEKVLLVYTNTYLGAHGEPYEIEEAYGEFNPCGDEDELIKLMNHLDISLEQSGEYYIARSKCGLIRKTGKSKRMSIIKCIISTLELNQCQHNQQ